MSAVPAVSRGALDEDRNEGFCQIEALLAERGDASAADVEVNGVMDKDVPA